MKNRYARNPDVSASARVYVGPYRWPGILHDGTMSVQKLSFHPVRYTNVYNRSGRSSSI